MNPMLQKAQALEPGSMEEYLMQLQQGLNSPVAPHLVWPDVNALGQPPQPGNNDNGQWPPAGLGTILQQIMAQSAPPLPPARPQGLGTNWGQGVPEYGQGPGANAQVQGLGGSYLFPSTQPTQLLTPMLPTERMSEAGRNDSGIYLGGGQHQAVPPGLKLDERTILRLLSGMTAR